MNAISYLSSLSSTPSGSVSYSSSSSSSSSASHGVLVESEEQQQDNDEVNQFQSENDEDESFLLKPFRLIWFVITSPLILIEYGLKSKQKVESTSTKGEIIRKKEVEDDLAEDEMFLQRDTIKGGLRGKAFGTKKMGRFLFPKKLVPQSIMFAERKKRLVVDLDETLIHSATRSVSHSNSAQGHMVEVRFPPSSISTLYYVHKRPHCDLFLSKVSKWYDLIIFTASMKEYADPVIDWLESSFTGKFCKRLYRHNCVVREGVGYIKDLSVVTEVLDEVVLIDNSPTSYARNEDNAIQVEGWISDPSDTDLLNLLPLLEALRYVTDVRSILGLKNGEKALG